MNDKSRPRIRVAAIVLEGDRILLAQHEKDGRRYYVLPGGGVEYGESLAQALMREMREETNLDVQVGELVLANDSIPPDTKRHIVNLYFTARKRGGTLRAGQNDKRLREVMMVPLDELAEAALYPDVRDELLLGIREGWAGGPRYLGNLWKEQE